MTRSILAAAFPALAAVCVGCGGGAPVAQDAGAGGATWTGADLWSDVAPIIRYQEDVPANPADARLTALACVSQKNSAPHGLGAPEEGATSPLTFSAAARNLLEDMRAAKAVIDGGLDGASIERLREPARGIRMHAAELVRAVEITERPELVAAILARARAGEEEPAAAPREERADEYVSPAPDEETAPEEPQLADLVGIANMNAGRLWAGTLMLSPRRVAKAWAALVDSCARIPEIKGQMGNLLSAPKVEASSQ